MKKHFKAVADYCEKSKIELNFENGVEDVGIWAEVGGGNLRIHPVCLSKLEDVIDRLKAFRNDGWEVV